MVHPSTQVSKLASTGVYSDSGDYKSDEEPDPIRAWDAVIVHHMLGQSQAYSQVAAS